MLKIRLSRVGKKKQPSYRVVVADARATRDGAFVDIVGRYNPVTNPKLIEFDADKVRDWISKGAQPTERVEKLLRAQGIIAGRPAAAGAAAVPSASATPAAEQAPL